MSIWQGALKGGGALMQDVCSALWFQKVKKYVLKGWSGRCRRQPEGWLTLEWQRHTAASKGRWVTQELACWSVEISGKSAPREEPIELHCRIPVKECERNLGITVALRTYGNHCQIHILSSALTGHQTQYHPLPLAYHPKMHIDWL